MREFRKYFASLGLFVVTAIFYPPQQTTESKPQRKAKYFFSEEKADMRFKIFN
jgi:hypothetical protein